MSEQSVTSIKELKEGDCIRAKNSRIVYKITNVSQPNPEEGDNVPASATARRLRSEETITVFTPSTIMKLDTCPSEGGRRRNSRKSRRRHGRKTRRSRK